MLQWINSNLKPYKQVSSIRATKPRRNSPFNKKEQIPKEDDDLSSFNNELSASHNLLILEQRVHERTIELESFTQAVSHDLRAPVRCINRFSQALLNTYGNILDDTGKRYLDIIQHNAQHMSDLIEILLSFFITSHKELDKTELNIDIIIDDIIYEQKIYAQDELKFIQKESLLSIFGDRNLIKLAFSNLISNAIKFSKDNPNRKIIIGSYNQGNEIVYYVKDNGAGFNMQYAEQLFCAFQRLHKSEEFEGIGIGLTIVQRIINRHGGKVWAEGKVNQGATFYFSIPVNN